MLFIQVRFVFQVISVFVVVNFVSVFGSFIIGVAIAIASLFKTGESSGARLLFIFLVVLPDVVDEVVGIETREHLVVDSSHAPENTIRTRPWAGLKKESIFILSGRIYWTVHRSSDQG